MLAAPHTQQLLQQHLVCGDGQQMPTAAWDSLLQGGLARTVLQLQRAPGMAVQLLAGDRLQFVLPLLVFRGEPVRLVLLVEQFSAAAGAGGAAAGSSATQLFYSGVSLAGFSEVYGGMRALGQCSWIGWVAAAVAELQRGFVAVELSLGSDQRVLVRLRVMH